MSGDNTITPNVNNDGCNGRTGDERPNHKGTDPMPADFTVIGRAWFGAVFDGLKAALKVAAPLVTTNPTATPVVIGVTSCIAKGVSFHGEWCRNPELQEQIRLGTADLERKCREKFCRPRASKPAGKPAGNPAGKPAGKPAGQSQMPSDPAGKSQMPSELAEDSHAPSKCNRGAQTEI